jgi:hypothetical protein
MINRTAIDTIKGYLYQFDFAIIKILELSQNTDTVIVEGIEDVDINTATEETAIQCKYYAKTEYNHSVIAKPIRLMLNHYKEVVNGNKPRINYKLYGFFRSGQSKLSHPIDIDFLKDYFLTYTENGIKYSHHTALNLNDSELIDFISHLSLDICALEYQAQLTKISNLLMKELRCTYFEAEHFFYNNALKVIKNIAIEQSKSKRTINKGDFLRQINLKQVLFHEWFITFKGEAKWFAALREQYFTGLNISPFERFFIIEVPVKNYKRTELKDLLFTIARKWSKLSQREQKPFCPYIYLHNIPQSELIKLKRELYLENVPFRDGFDFDGATFNSKSLTKPILHNNPIKLKILNKIEYLSTTITEVSNTKEIYQFYNSSTFFENEQENIKHVKIQVAQLTDIKKII